MSKAPHIDRGRWGLSWTLREPMARSSHALAVGKRLWLVDPVADESALAAVEALGKVAGVLQLLDRHNRDCAALAKRYRVEHLRLPSASPERALALRRMLSLPLWREQALWWEDAGVLLVSEAVGTIGYFAVHGGAAGMHPFLRGWPPQALRELRDLRPQILLCGHGRPLTKGVGAALDEALARSRLDMPRAALAVTKAFLPRR